MGTSFRSCIIKLDEKKCRENGKKLQQALEGKMGSYEGTIANQLHIMINDDSYWDATHCLSRDLAINSALIMVGRLSEILESLEEELETGSPNNFSVLKYGKAGLKKNIECFKICLEEVNLRKAKNIKLKDLSDQAKKVYTRIRYAPLMKI